MQIEQEHFGEKVYICMDYKNDPLLKMEISEFDHCCYTKRFFCTLTQNELAKNFRDVQVDFAD